jgi:hypothetical protein
MASVAGNEYAHNQDKIDLKAEEKRKSKRTSAWEKRRIGRMAVSNRFSRKEDEHE